MGSTFLANMRSVAKSKPAGFLTVIGAFLVQLTLGSIYTYGNMSTYILAYMNSSNAQSEINAGNAMWIFGLAVFGLGAAMTLGGFIDSKLDSSATILIGGLIMSFGVVITGWTITVHLAAIAVSYGLITGVGCGIAYGVSIATSTEWFPDSKGFVSGLVVSGFGLGALLFDFIQTSMINPNVTDVKLKDTTKVPRSFVIMGSIYATLQIIGALLIRKPKPGVDQVVESKEINSFFDDLSDTPEVCIKPYELFFELDFWVLWITLACNSVVAVMVLSLHKVYGQQLYFSDIKLVVVSALAGFCNGTGRIVWGFLNDRITYKVLMSILTLCMALMLGTFYITCLIGDLRDANNIPRYVYYFFWVLVLHFLLSGNFSLFPTICVKTFGSKHYAKNFGILFTAYSFAGILTSAVTTKNFSNSLGEGHTKEFLTPFLIGTGLSIISCLLTLCYRGRSLMYKASKATMS